MAARCQVKLADLLRMQSFDGDGTRTGPARRNGRFGFPDRVNGFAVPGEGPDAQRVG